MSSRRDVEAQRERERREERERRTQPAPSRAAAAATSRMHEYFVPRDGIDREVITADICRYLGNDALVRPGVYDVSIRIFCLVRLLTATRTLRQDNHSRVTSSKHTEILRGYTSFLFNILDTY